MNTTNFGNAKRWLKAMRLILLIISFCLSCLSFGQDSLQIDTGFKESAYTGQDSVRKDSASSISKAVTVKTKKQKKKVQEFKTKQEPLANKESNSKDVDANRDDNGLILIGLLLTIIIIVLAISRSTFAKTYKHGTTSLKDKEFKSDYLNRIFLSRRNYYRNVYLKSEAWQRKRYVVLKRDNWRCVYCGGQATQVHHTRYAKRNIGKEPIEWLVSVCKTCHDSKH